MFKAGTPCLNEVSYVCRNEYCRSETPKYQTLDNSSALSLPERLALSSQFSGEELTCSYSFSCLSTTKVVSSFGERGQNWLQIINKVHVV